MGEHKNISTSLNLFGAGSVSSFLTIPVTSINSFAGVGLFCLSLGCNAVAAMVLTIDNTKPNSHTPKEQFNSAVSSMIAGGIGVVGATVYTIKDIIIQSPTGFSSLGAGFAMASGVAAFYGGLKSASDAGKRNDFAHLDLKPDV